MGAPKNYNWKHGRGTIPVLVVYSNGTISNQLRSSLKTMGFNTVSAAPSHVAAIDRIRGRDFALVLFESSPTDMPPVEFVTQLFAMDSSMILVAVSGEPRVDDVFGLLRAGARSFLALPFTVDSMEGVVMRASEGAPFSDAVLQAPDRNAALVGCVLNNLYKTAVLQRQAREFDSAAKEVVKQQYMLSESMDLARLFCEGGDDALQEKIIEGCIARANTAATRLGRMRKKLAKERTKDGSPATA